MPYFNSTYPIAQTAVCPESPSAVPDEIGIAAEEMLEQGHGDSAKSNS